MISDARRRLASALHAGAYEAVSRVLLAFLRVGSLRRPLVRASNVVLRQGRTLDHLRLAGYDGIIDGGAGIGEFAALARAACPEIPLICVEPHPASAATLRRRGFNTLEAALWSHAGKLTLRQLTHARSSCSVLTRLDPADVESWQVDAVRLDQIALKGERILLKLDLQGAELEALEGMGDLWPRCAAILTEVSFGAEGTYRPLRATLLEHGYLESATFNELEVGGRVLEADKLWLRPEEPLTDARG